MNKELSMCIYGALSITKVLLPYSRRMQVMRGVYSFSAAGFLYILLNITNHNHNK